MSLTGIDPTDPTPSARREFVLGAAPSNGAASQYPILLFGNKLSGGTETVETIGQPLAGLDDCATRFGARSEIYQEARVAYMADPDALLYACAVAEPSSSPTQASCTFTFVSVATDTTTVDVFWGGFQTSFTINTGDSISAMATNLANALNNMLDGTCPFTASASLGVTTVTMSQNGDRGQYYLTPLRVISRKASSQITTTITKSSVTNGSGTDSMTNALAAAAAAGEFRLQVNPKYQTTGPTSTDGGIGEHLSNINTQVLPINGKAQVAFFGLIGTQANGTTVTTASAVNNPFAYFVRQKNSDWAPAMLAAHVAAACRFQWITYPAFNMIGYQDGVSTPFKIPAQYTKADVATAGEIKADLNNGISTITQDQRGVVQLVRLITSRSLNAAGQNDYTVREGHIPIVDFAYWDAFLPIWNSRKQPNVAADRLKGQKPLPLVTYPKAVAGWMSDLASDFAGPNPLGLYPGPLFAPDKLDAILASVNVSKISGGVSCFIDTQAVEHLVKSETKIRDVTASQ